MNNEDLYAKLAEGEHEAQRYIERIDEHGNMYLVDANQAEEYGEEEGYMDDDEFLEMMEREAAAGRL